MNRYVARSFLIVFVLFALLELVQQVFHPIKLTGLQGAFNKGEVPVFNFNTWLKGTYQQQADYYLKYNTAFNGDMVRIRNQANYSLFGKINTILVTGKENFIFDPSYIYALNGTDYINDSAKYAKIKDIEKTLSLLESIHVPLYAGFAPNKAFFYSEYLPDKLMQPQYTNKQFYDSLFQTHNVPVIDFSNWFSNMKDTSKYLLVPKYGAHWSTYGAFLAADSLFNFLQSQSASELADFMVDKIEIKDKAQFTDDDYLPSLNLMIKWESPRMAYPVLKFTPGKKLSVLIISDSFIWNFYDLGIIANCFSSSTTIRYYNKTEFDNNKREIGPVKPLSIAELSKYDFIWLLNSDPSLKDFGFGFFESTALLVKND